MPIFKISGAQSGAFIVEDDYTSEFRYSGPPLASLQGLDEDERVICVGTLNKALSSAVLRWLAQAQRSRANHGRASPQEPCGTRLDQQTVEPDRSIGRS